MCTVLLTPGDNPTAVNKYIISMKTRTHVPFLDYTVCSVQGGSNMTGTDLCVNKPHCAAAVRP